MRNPSVLYTVSSSSLPGPTKVVYAQLQHERCGDLAWMRKTEDVRAAFIDKYQAGELEEYTKEMTATTYSMPWPPIADHLPNFALDMGGSRALEPNPPSLCCPRCHHPRPPAL